VYPSSSASRDPGLVSPSGHGASQGRCRKMAEREEEVVEAEEEEEEEREEEEQEEEGEADIERAKGRDSSSSEGAAHCTCPSFGLFITGSWHWLSQRGTNSLGICRSLLPRVPLFFVPTL
jgi:hypothetical protein